MCGKLLLKAVENKGKFLAGPPALTGWANFWRAYSATGSDPQSGWGGGLGSRGRRGGPLGAGLGETLVFAAGFLRRQYPERIDAQRGPERKAQQR